MKPHVRDRGRLEEKNDLDKRREKVRRSESRRPQGRDAAVKRRSKTYEPPTRRQPTPAQKRAVSDSEEYTYETESAEASAPVTRPAAAKAAASAPQRPVTTKKDEKPSADRANALINSLLATAIHEGLK